MKIQYPLLIILFLLNSSGESMSDESPTYGECYTLVHPFFNKLPDEIQFSQYNLERQYITYICGIQETHPPTIYLAIPFAKKEWLPFHF